MNSKKLTRIIREELRKLKKRNLRESRLLREEDTEWWCNCTDGGCYGTIDFEDQSSDCSCCDEDCEMIRKDVDRNRGNLGGIGKPGVSGPPRPTGPTMG